MKVIATLAWRIDGMRAVALASAALALAALISLGVRAQLTSGAPDKPADLPPPTPTVAAAAGGTRESALQRAGSNVPGVSALVEAVERSDLEVVLRSLRYQDVPCTPSSHKGGPGPWCEQRAVPEGTTFVMFPERISIIRFFEDPYIRLVFEQLLGAHPRLELVATHVEGWLYLSFAIDQVADLKSGTIYSSFGFGVDASNPGRPAIWFERRLPLATPLDSIREFEMDGIKRYEVLFISPELRAKDDANDALHREGAKDAPTTPPRPTGTLTPVAHP